MGNARALREGGFGLIETMIAIFVLAIFVLSVGSTLINASQTTGQANLEVTANGLARQELTYWEQQLAADSVDDFPAPFPCAVTQQITGTTSSKCPGQNVANARTNALAVPAAVKVYAYCTPIGNLSTPPTCNAAAAANAALAASAYTVVTSASWQCDPGSRASTGGMAAIPYLYINVQVTWPSMGGLAPQTNAASSSGGTASPVSMSAEVTPPAGIQNVDVSGYPIGQLPPQAVTPQVPDNTSLWYGTPSNLSLTSVSNTGNNTCASPNVS